MSDDPVLADVSADAAQGADAEGSPPPWGDDFNAERAWKTISHLRGREKELESDAKAWKRFREDEEYRREALGELGYEFDESDDEFSEEDFADDDPAANDPRIDKFDKWMQEQQQKEARREFNEHLDRLSSDESQQFGVTKLSKQERDWVLAQSVQNGFSPKATEDAYKALREWLDERDKSAVERYRSTKKAPNTPPQTGKAGEQTFDPTDRKARRARFAAIAEGQAD